MCRKTGLFAVTMALSIVSLSGPSAAQCKPGRPIAAA